MLGVLGVGLLAVAFLACFLVYFVQYYLESKYLPPGPFPFPVIGNLHLLSSKPHLDFYRLSKTYGPVYRLRMGRSLVIVINNITHAKEAMLKRGTDFAGRPFHYVGSLFSRNGKGVGFQTFSETFKTQHKAIGFKIKEKAMQGQKLERIVEKEVDELIRRLQQNAIGSASVDPLVDITFAFGNIVAILVFGERYKDGDNRFWDLMDALTIFVQGLAATSYIDTFPLLKFIPFSIIRKVKNAVNVRDNILNGIYKKHKAKLQNDVLGNYDLTDYLIDIAKSINPHKVQKNILTEDHIVMTMNDAIMAGSETPRMNFMWMMYYLIKYPNVQKKVARELHDVIGTRAPQWDDRHQLPYLEAFISEALRHSSVMPLAIPHHALCDSVIGSYQVPKGTTVLLNIYSIHHDPEIWHNPMEFNPERFLDEKGRYRPECDRNLISFGIGHRACPGEVLARMESFLFTTRLVATFTLEGDKNEALPNVEDCYFGITLRPAPFKVCFVPRNGYLLRNPSKASIPSPIHGT